jgi:carbonic anhydrase/acetyltransferase-like protein (isoleucine patch superfamily)
VIEDAIICDKAIIKQGAKIGSGSIISFSVVVKEGKQIPKHTIASKFTYNADSAKFEKSKEKEGNDESLFEEGEVTYMPREFVLKAEEHLGATLTSNLDDDSDFGESDDEDVNNKDAFKKEAREIIERCQKNRFSL